MNNDELESADHLSSSDLSICENMAQHSILWLIRRSFYCKGWEPSRLDYKSCKGRCHGSREMPLMVMREEYHLTAKDGNHLGWTMLLNGNPLELTEDGNILALNPVLVPVNSPISVAPLSIVFVVFPNFEAKACV